MSSSLLFLRALQSEIAPVNVNKLTIIMGDFNCSVEVSLPHSAFINVNEFTHISNNKPRLILPLVNRPILDFDKIDIVGLASELRHIDW